ncbi:MAG: hypothetical protein ACP5GZ_09265 [Vulcanisaeta sp.]|uniref:hypothetical protein n=1 Tax=Vulcanisaeta sp. TaxID=2020871 RepID=UPI003D116416
MLIPPEEAPALVMEFLERSIRAVGLQLIISVRRRAIRLGVWWRVDPLRRGLLEASIQYLRRGLRFRSPRALAMLREAIIEALTLVLMRSTRFMAFIIGSRIARAFGRVVRVAELIAVGIQWLNTPPEYRAVLNGA